ncbi:peptidylprolyl isomerase [Paludibacterium sp. B53371]|uniref:peptidylprolyl isomerase n=1 Tax=Paludibacterium sp. B53371 TaxID=2806263 RepID=UPI001C0519F8|nr:peptidylprolyl isomerase [Paludibacterium sp. B53371]
MTMKKTLLALLTTAAISSAMAAPVVPVDRIVAVVNKSVITELELQKRVSQATASLQEQHVTPPPMDVLRRQVLDQMITEQTELQYADSNRISVTDGDIDQAIQRVAQQNKTDVNGLRQLLSKQGLDMATFRTEVRRELLLSKLKESVIASRVNVTDSEVEQALKNPQFANHTEYHLANILIDVPERADAAQIDSRMQRARQALAELKAGKPFANVAAAYSSAPNAMRGGDIGWRPAASLPSDFTSMLEALKPGGITDIIRTQQGFYIFQLVEKRSQQAQQMAEQYHTFHILIRTNEAVSESDAKAKILQIRDRILRGASFQEMAKLYSEDGSNTKGGDLGWLSKGDTVPEFEQAMTTLPLNTLSEPVRSPFGWHLIKVEAKRTEDVTADRSRSVVRQQIRNRKVDEAYLDWVHQLRDSAFVDDRLNEQQ